MRVIKCCSLFEDSDYVRHDLAQDEKNEEKHRTQTRIGRKILYLHRKKQNVKENGCYQ